MNAILNYCGESQSTLRAIKRMALMANGSGSWRHLHDDGSGAARDYVAYSAPVLRNSVLPP